MRVFICDGGGLGVLPLALDVRLTWVMNVGWLDGDAMDGVGE